MAPDRNDKDSILGKSYFNYGGVPSNLNTKGSGPLYDATNTLANHLGLYVDIHARHCNVRVAFKAFMTAFEDTVDLNFEDEPQMGAITKPKNFKGVARQLSIGLKLPAANVDEARMNLRNVSLLVKSLHPVQELEFDPSTGRMVRAQAPTSVPYFSIRFLNLLVDGNMEKPDFASAAMSGLTGYMDDVKYSLVMDDDGGGFLADRGTNGTKAFTQHVYPKLITLNFVFYPYFTVDPAWSIQSGKEGISPEDGTYFFGPNNYPYQYESSRNTQGNTIINASTNINSNDTISEADKARINRAFHSGRRK